ncbi:hypothetical protein [Streptomyces sp. NPDC047043]|uniref:tetratricopeptide repeat protein n=1 Tax=Streptomyces sp. NPDC047043 TaxID=3154497 RepID=UPI0033CE1D64
MPRAVIKVTSVAGASEGSHGRTSSSQGRDPSGRTDGPRHPERAAEGGRPDPPFRELLGLLRHGTDDTAEFLTLQTIHEHLARVLPSKGHPRPELRGTHTVGRLALARNRARSAISDPDAMVKEAGRLERIGDGAGAVHWYRQAAGAGRSDAMRELGRLLERDGNHVQAGLWRRRAAESGDPTSMHELGVSSWHTGNLTEAELWLGKAAAAGVPEAAEDLERLRRRRKDQPASSGSA